MAPLVWLATGCGDNFAHTTDAAPTVDAGLSAVSGSLAYRFHPDTGEPSTVPFDLSSIAVSAWMLREDGSFREIPGVGREDGRFVIEDVPETAVYIQVGSTFVHTSGREIDLGRDLAGRLDWDIGAEDAVLRIDAAGLTPWESLDSLAFVSSNMGLYLPFLEAFAEPPIDADATSLSGIDFVGLYPLVDAAAGDRLSLHQISTGSAGGRDYWFITKSLDVAPITFGPSETTVTGAFEDVPTQSLHLDWNATAWVSLADDVNPDAYPYSALLQFIARPVLGDDFFAPELISLFAGSETLGDFTYGDPFPAGWDRTIDVTVPFDIEIALPGQTEPSYFYALMHTSLSEEAYGEGPLTLPLTPPRSPRVNDILAYRGRTGVGTTPTISWLPPSLGQPTGYRVEVYRFSDDGSVYPQERIAEIFTESTTITIPPGVFLDGEPHAIAVFALSQPNGDPLRPYRATVPRAETPALTSLLIP